jgi:hypothetical protein
MYLLSSVGLKLLHFTQLLEPRGSAVLRFQISCETYFLSKLLHLH